MKTRQFIIVVCLLGLARWGQSWSVPPSCTLNDFILNGCKTDTQGKGDDQASKGGLVTDCPPNVVFVVDGSDSVSPSGYRQALESLYREIRTATQTLANTHIGVVLFSESIQDMPLQQRTLAEIEDLIRQIQNIQQPRRQTSLSRALTRAREMLQDYSMIESRAYNGIKSGSVIVLLTDGQTDYRQQVIQEAKLAKDNGVLIISLSLENPDGQLLKYISHVVQDHLKAVNWTSLVACPGRVLDPVQRGRKCKDILIVVDGSDSVLRHKETVRQYLVHTALRFRLINNAIGVNVYGTNSQIQSADTRIRLKDDKYDLAEKIRLGLAFPTSGGTGTDRAIIQSVGMLNDDLREQPAALILITDGPTFDPQATRTAYQNALNNEYPVIVVRVGTAMTNEELSLITGGDLTNVFSVSSFTDLFGVDFVSRICDACQTQCPSNARLTGQCGCTCVDPDFVYVASNNSCMRIDKTGCAYPCPSNAYRGSGCSCVCLDGRNFNEATRLCDCPKICPSNSRQTEQCGCVCWDTSLVYNTSSNTCMAPSCSQQCPFNAQRTANCECQCWDNNLVYNSINNLCETRPCTQECPSNAQRTANCGCQCWDSNLVYNSSLNQCVVQGCSQQCPTNAQRTTTCGCQCWDSSLIYNSTINQCVTRSCSQECPTNAQRTANCGCQCWDSNLVYNSINNQCVAQTCAQQCPFNAQRTVNCGCQCLDSNLDYNSIINQCVTKPCTQECPFNAQRTINCGCLCSDSSLVYNSNINQCVVQTCSQQCPFNAQRTANCGCQCWDSNLVYNSINNQCETKPCTQECPFNAQRTTNCGCLCSDSSLVYNSNINQCVVQTCSQQCPTNAQRTANCGCQCWDSNLVYNSINNQCETKPCTQECPFNAQRTANCGCQCSDSSLVYNSIINQCGVQTCSQQCPTNAQRTANCGCQCWDSNLVYNSINNQCVTSICARDCPVNARRTGNCDCQCFNTSQVFNVNTNLCESVLSQCTRSEFSCENNQVAYKDCNGDCFCACSTGYAGTRCEIRLQAELCNDCYYDNGHYHAGVVGYCSLYVSCVPLDVQTNSSVRPTSFVPYIMSCPPGTFYITRPDGWKGCDYLSNGRCAQDQCESLPAEAMYSDSSACQSYWKCGSNRRLESKLCCPAGQRFDSRSGQCVVDSSCPVTCGRSGAGRCDGGGSGDGDDCPFAINAANPNEYFYKTRPSDLLRCQASDIMNLTVCGCVLNPNPNPTACKPVVDMNFDLPSTNIENNVPQIVVGNAIAANFNGSNDVFLKMFAGSGFWTDYFQINLRLYLNTPVSSGQRTAVVTNADCSTGESVSITMDERNFYFTVYQIGSSQPAEIVIPYASRTDRNGWISLVLVYKRVSGGFLFSGTVGDYTEVYRGTVSLTNNIDIRTCALHLGQGYRYAGLVGYVDDFQVWRCDPKS